MSSNLHLGYTVVGLGCNLNHVRFEQSFSTGFYDYKYGCPALDYTEANGYMASIPGEFDRDHVTGRFPAKPLAGQKLEMFKKQIPGKCAVCAFCENKR